MAVIVREVEELDLYVPDLIIVDRETLDLIHEEITLRVGEYFKKITKSLILSTLPAFKGELRYKGKGKTIKVKPFIYEIETHKIKHYALVQLGLPVEGQEWYKEMLMKYVLKKISLTESEDVYVNGGVLVLRIPINGSVKESGTYKNGQKCFKKL